MSGEGDDEALEDGDWVEATDEKTAVERAIESPAAPVPKIDPWAEVSPLIPSLDNAPAPTLGGPLLVNRRAPTARAPEPPSPDRSYPLMRALLADPSAVPYGSVPSVRPKPPPVPGTFFPAPREPIPKPVPADLDSLLGTMAEGLLIGEDANGHSEVRVTLKDEFFAGTELRITVGDGEVHAALYPPDREIYWQLNGNLDALRERLEARGLKVAKVEVIEP